MSHGCVLAIVGSRTLEANPQRRAGHRTCHRPTRPVGRRLRRLRLVSTRWLNGTRWRVASTRISSSLLGSDGTAPAGTRNATPRIANACDHLVCIYDPDSKTRGSGWTADIAEKLGKEVTRVAIQGREQ